MSSVPTSGMNAYARSGLCRYLEEALRGDLRADQGEWGACTSGRPGISNPKRLREPRTSGGRRRDRNHRLRRRALCSPREAESEMTISSEEAIERARRCAEERGWVWREPVIVKRSRAFVLIGRVRYEVRTNAEMRGSNARSSWMRRTGASPRRTGCPGDCRPRWRTRSDARSSRHDVTSAHVRRREMT